jgi:V-type H+-transporting ATPase subunit C
VLKALCSHYSYLKSAADPSRRPKAKSSNTAGGEEIGGEWAGVMEEEWLDYVLFEVPKL